jgi:hypothetical protein
VFSLKCEVDNLEELCALCLLSALCSLLSAIRFAYFLIEDECFQQQQQQRGEQEQSYFSILYKIYIYHIYILVYTVP